MQAGLKSILGIIFYCFATLVFADLQASTGYNQVDSKPKLRVDLFLSSTCPHCQKADKFFADLESKENWLDIHRYEIDKDKASLNAFYQMLQQQNANTFSVPTIFFCNSRWVGFADDGSSEKALLSGLNYCRQQIATTGKLTTAASDYLKQSANAYDLTLSISGNPSTASFIPLMALTEALSACAIFCVLALFAFIWLGQKPALQIRCGLLFLATLSVAHFIQQVHAVFFYQILVWLRILAVFIGLGLLAFIFKSFWQDLNQKMVYPFVILTELTALILQAYQQTCTPNFALIFEQWLLSQQFSVVKQQICRVIYQGIYVIPLLLMLLIIVSLVKQKRLLRHRSLLTQFSWINLTVIAVLLIAYPQYLANMGISLLVFVFSLIVAWLTKAKATWNMSKKTF